MMRGIQGYLPKKHMFLHGALVAAAFVPGAAQACLTAESYGYVFLKTPPKNIPPGASVLQVRMPVIDETLPPETGVRAIILSGKDRGKVAAITPSRWPACGAWVNLPENRRLKAAYMVGDVYRTRGGIRGSERIGIDPLYYGVQTISRSVRYAPEHFQTPAAYFAFIKAAEERRREKQAGPQSQQKAN